MKARGLFAAAAVLTACPTVAEVPLSYAVSGHPTVPALVGRQGPYQFVFDTGAEGTAVYSWFARELGLEPMEGKAETLQGQTGSASAELVRLPALSVDGRSVSNLEAVVLPDRADGVPLPGIIGLDLMGTYVVEFDAPSGRVALHPAGTHATTLGGTSMKATKAVRLAGGLLGIPVAINGARGLAVLDTGARDTRINWRFARAAGLHPGSVTLKDDGAIQGATNNAVAAKRGIVGTVELGGIRRKAVSARVVDLPVFQAFGVADRPAMILGMDLLKDIHLVADFPNATVWMVQRAKVAAQRKRQ
jgi:predicted aspartyl protease